MAGRTLSAYVDQTTAEQVADMARREDRSPAQIAAAALRLYCGLPAQARDAWRALEAAQDPRGLDEAAWAVARALLEKRFHTAWEQGVASMPERDPSQDEEAILAEAVALARRR